MDALREILRNHLGRSLGGLAIADRLAAAWVVVCGPALAGRGEIVGYEDGQAVVAVEAGPWMEQFRAMQEELRGGLERVAGVRVTGIHLIRKRASGSR